MIDVANEKKFTLRIPDDLHEQLKLIADQDMRSLHSQILVLLRDAVERRPAQRNRDQDIQEARRKQFAARERKLPNLDDEPEAQP